MQTRSLLVTSEGLSDWIAIYMEQVAEQRTAEVRKKIRLHLERFAAFYQERNGNEWKIFSQPKVSQPVGVGLNPYERKWREQ